MDSRQELILTYIIEEYIKTAEPVGSKFLLETFDLPVSAATIRNDMARLEHEGYLVSPHASAGRVPTEKAYLYYLREHVKRDAPKKVSPLSPPVPSDRDVAPSLKRLARGLVEASGEMAVLTSTPSLLYYTGVTNLFEKPDFQDQSCVHDLSLFLDRLDEAMVALTDSVPEHEPIVMIGTQNPLGDVFSAIVIRYRLPY